MFFVSEILALVLVALARALLPHAVAFSESLFEVSLEIAAVGPVVLSVAAGFSFGVLAFVQITIGEFFGALTVF
jgi:hypothetical protein